MSALRRFNIRQQLIGLFATVLLMGVVLLVADAWNRRDSLEALRLMRVESLETLRLAKSVSDAYGLDVVDTTFRVRNGLISWPEGQAQIARTRAQLPAQWAQLQSLAGEGRNAILMRELARYRLGADATASELQAILALRDMEALGQFADRRLYPRIDPVTLRLKALTQAEQLRVEERVLAETARTRQQALLRAGIVVGVMVVFAVVGRALLKRVYRGVETLTRFARSIQRQEFSGPPPSPLSGELGDVLAAMTAMREALARSQSEIAASEQRARDASRAKSSFVATMSHEIRTPLIGVTGMLEVLGHTRLDAEQRGIVDIVQQSAGSLMRIIGDVLDFSKIEADRLTIDLQPADLRRLVAETTGNFTGAASARGLVIEARFGEGLAAAYRVDALRLRQVLSNLIGNAVKFTEQGGVTVRLSLLGADPALHRLCFEVEDTGIGIDATQQQALFEPFQQAEQSTTRRFGGTGLGLSISRRLVELMNGTLAMRSEPGKGTCVRIEIALSPAALPAPTPRVASASATEIIRQAPSRDEAMAQGRLVLLVDDHPTNRIVIARQLALAGYASDLAVDGVDALAACARTAYGLVLTDLHMPRMDGYALAAALRGDEAAQGRARRPIVALSAAVTAEDVARCLASGMDRHLPKPVTVPQLAEAMDSLLGPPPPAGSPTVTSMLPAVREAPTASAVAEFDRSVLLDLAGGDAATAAELFGEFLATCDADLAALRNALDSDAETAQRQAHRMKGAARLVGALELARAAGDFEEALRVGRPADLEALADALTALRHAHEG
jgi:signal transduction histidine kinase/HPt (histidine-containing phosphotransfer) domain-containing protein/ActR/RegA family two-component response regulator